MTGPPPLHRVEVDLDRLESNAREVARRAGSRQVIAVVKADAYGHGASEAARAFLQGGVHGLAVFLVDEGLHLRAAAIERPVLILGPLPAEDTRRALDAGLVPTVHSTTALEPLVAEARRRGCKVSFQLKVDTGMGRLGVPLVELPNTLTALGGSPELQMTGLLSHLACAEQPDHPLNGLQRTRFVDALLAVRAAGHQPQQTHLGNSAWLLQDETDPGNTIRPGLALYGLSPVAGLEAAGLRPALRFCTRVVQVKEIAPGGAVGYGATWSATEPRRIAVLPVGYAEGVPRGLDQGGEVLVAGRRAPIVGRISMDLTTIDVTGMEGVRTGTPVTLLGAEGDQEIKATDWARLTGAIPWEILCAIPARVRRLHVRGATETGR